MTTARSLLARRKSLIDDKFIDRLLRMNRQKGAKQPPLFLLFRMLPSRREA